MRSMPSLECAYVYRLFKPTYFVHVCVCVLLRCFELCTHIVVHTYKYMIEYICMVRVDQMLHDESHMFVFRKVKSKNYTCVIVHICGPEHTCIYIYMCMYIYIHIYVCVFICIYIYVYIYVCEYSVSKRIPS